MRARRITVASLTLCGLYVSFCSPARAEQAPATPAPTNNAATQPPQPPPYPDQQQPYQQQPYQQQPYQQQPYQQQPYQQQPYQQQPYQPQPYQQPYQPQPYQQQPYYPQAQPGYAVPQRGTVRYVNRPRLGLVIAGAVTLGTSWLITSLAAAANNTYDGFYGGSLDGGASSGGSFGYASQLWPLYIPVLGPWIEMGYLSGSGAPVGIGLLAFDGLVQAGGLAMIIGGAVSRTRVAIYAKNGTTKTDLTFSPLLGASSGLLVLGHF